MPYDGEFASYAPLRRIRQNPKVKKLEGRFKVVALEEQGEELGLASDDLVEERQPEMVLAIDGGRQSVEVKTGYPGAEIGYITVGAVLVFLDKLSEVAQSDIIDPVEYRKTKQSGSFDTVLPGRSVLVDGEDSAEASMRLILFEELASHTVLEGSETLLETYEHLMLKEWQEGVEAGIYCPWECGKRYHYERGKYECRGCGRPLYSTDALRLHELFSPHESCEKLFGQTMTTLERLWLISVLRAFERRGDDWLRIVGQMAFIVDGPLAVYGVSAWLSTPIRGELERLNAAQKEFTRLDMMILGIEKTGGFARHFEMLDSRGEDGELRFPARKSLLLDDDYIRRHIVPSSGNRQYGGNTYFGRKFLYKSSLGHRLVVNTATFNEAQFSLATALPEQFPRLADTLALLDKLSSNLYPNALSPLIAAHAEAAIPLNLGGKILEEAAKKAMQGD